MLPIMMFGLLPSYREQARFKQVFTWEEKGKEYQQGSVLLGTTSPGQVMVPSAGGKKDTGPTSHWDLTMGYGRR